MPEEPSFICPVCGEGSVRDPEGFWVCPNTLAEVFLNHPEKFRPHVLSEQGGVHIKKAGGIHY